MFILGNAHRKILSRVKRSRLHLPLSSGSSPIKLVKPRCPLDLSCRYISRNGGVPCLRDISEKICSIIAHEIRIGAPCWWPIIWLLYIRHKSCVEFIEFARASLTHKARHKITQAKLDVFSGIRSPLRKKLLRCINGVAHVIFSSYRRTFA
jgi:hypothetical protein